MMNLVSQDQNFFRVVKQGVVNGTEGINRVDIFDDDGVILDGVVIGEQVDDFSPVFLGSLSIECFACSSVP